MPDQQQAKTVLKQFRIIFGAVKQHFRKIEATCGISGSQLWLLNEIAMYPELGISKLAERLAIHQSTCSLLVEKLVKKKLVEKQRQEDDQRKVGLMITQLGKAILAKAPQPVDGILPQLLAGLNEYQLTSLESSLNIIISKLADEDQRLAEQPLADI